ncbi:hypothetical protein TRICI_003986 [Trichomonascus ciferrii]|uniref:Uncharacterized protein n=1 Tax=Trichomonascus ciferrii TaxID=44093 RepID=A0A642V8H6_9ASCO|nr:hypothetical protein TRICI_003986 [Trichomonascus ciferrii]
MFGFPMPRLMLMDGLWWPKYERSDFVLPPTVNMQANLPETRVTVTLGSIDEDYESYFDGLRQKTRETVEQLEISCYSSSMNGTEEWIEGIARAFPKVSRLCLDAEASLLDLILKCFRRAQVPVEALKYSMILRDTELEDTYEVLCANDFLSRLTTLTLIEEGGAGRDGVAAFRRVGTLLRNAKNLEVFKFEIEHETGFEVVRAADNLKQILPEQLLAVKTNFAVKNPNGTVWIPEDLGSLSTVVDMARQPDFSFYSVGSLTYLDMQLRGKYLGSPMQHPKANPACNVSEIRMSVDYRTQTIVPALAPCMDSVSLLEVTYELNEEEFDENIITELFTKCSFSQLKTLRLEYTFKGLIQGLKNSNYASFPNIEIIRIERVGLSRFPKNLISELKELATHFPKLRLIHFYAMSAIAQIDEVHSLSQLGHRVDCWNEYFGPDIYIDMSKFR